MAEIFISYRRDDSAAESRAIWERLRAEVGRDRVFMDVTGIPAGDDFAETIDSQLQGCRLMLVIIGSSWASIKDRAGRPRLHLANDYVRYEVATALKAAAEKRMRVVPVLIDDAVMPQEDELPAALHALMRRHAHELDFKRHTEAALQTLVDLARDVLGKGQPASPPPRAAPITAPAVIVPKPLQAWMSAQGEDQYGHWADLTVKSAVQRMRWIKPGEFWMGSPQSERDAIQNKDVRQWAHDHEHEPCKIVVGQGFWLADTPCTQALWTQVSDRAANPSGFQKGQDAAHRPVERVSWDDVQQWFERLMRLDPGTRGVIALPTEVQWEYAARAGMRSAYWWGDQWDDAKGNANSKGDRPGDGSKGATTPVKQYPPNPWGLYDLHGNVWEWCEDAWREPPDAGGEADPSERALRGGSWISLPGGARSAYRGWGHRGDADRLRGFRLSLRSPGPEAGGRR